MGVMDITASKPESRVSHEWEPSINVGSLSPEDKKVLWAHLKKHHPDLAQQIQVVMQDPGAQALVEHFGASLTIKPRYLPPRLIPLAT